MLWLTPVTALLSVSDEEASAAEDGRAESEVWQFNPVGINGLNEMWFALKTLTRE